MKDHIMLGVFVTLTTLVVVLILSAEAMGELTVTPDVEVYFEYMNNRTTSAYVGQDWISLMTVYNENATNWEVVMRSPLFDTWLRGWTARTIEAGSGHGHSLDFKESAPPGVYDITVNVKYTTDDGNDKDHRFELQLTYVKAWSMKDFRISEDDKLMVTLETFLEFDVITVEFDTDGSLAVDPEWQNMTSVEPGIYTLETDVFEVGRNDPRFGGRFDEDEVGYDIRGWVNGTYLQFWEKNVNPDDVREKGQGDSFQSLFLVIPVITGFGVIMAVFFWYKGRSTQTHRSE